MISLGPGPVRAPLPNLLNKPITEAKTSLAAFGLKDGKVLTKKDPGRPKDRIIMTRPGPFEMVSEGQSIDILVSSGNDPGTAKGDDLKQFEVANIIPEPPPPSPPTAAGT